MGTGDAGASVGWRELPPAAFTAYGLQSIIQHVAHSAMDASTRSQPKTALLAHDQEHLIITKVFRHDADKCARGRIESLLFQCVQTAQALRQDNSRIESAALGGAQPNLGAVADHQQDVCIELLRCGCNNRLQSGTIKVF